MFGYFLVGSAALTGALAFGLSAARAIGLGYLPFLVASVDSLCVSRSIHKFGVKVGPAVAWLVVQALVVGGILLAPAGP